jgi:hypothetical protein
MIVYLEIVRQNLKLKKHNNELEEKNYE